MNQQESFETLCSRLGVKFLCPIVNLSQSSKVGELQRQTYLFACLYEIIPPWEMCCRKKA